MQEEEDKTGRGVKNRKTHQRHAADGEDLGEDLSGESSSDEAFEVPGYVLKRKVYKDREFYRKRNAYKAKKLQAHKAGIKPEVPDSYLTGQYTKIDVARFKRNWPQISELPMVKESREKGSRYTMKKELRQEYIQLAIDNGILS